MAIQIAVANHKGGCGKTTIASHLLWWAAAQKIRCHGIAVDPQGNLIQRVLDDPRLQRERVYRANDWLDLTYSPNALPASVPQSDLIVLDFPPGFDICNIARPYLWLVPIDGREAIDGLMTAVRTMQVGPGGQGVCAVLNMIDGAGRLPVNAAREALGMVPKLKLWPDPIPDTAVIQRSAEYRRPTWLIPNGKNTAGDVAMRKFCAGVLSLVGLGAKGR